jgi:hypothetical protein
MVGRTPDRGDALDGQSTETAREKPAGWGSEEQKLPEVTFAGMPYCARSLCRAAGPSSSFGLMASVAVPLALLTSVNDAVLIVPGVRAGPSTPVRPSASPVPAAAPAMPRPVTCALPLVLLIGAGGQVWRRLQGGGDLPHSLAGQFFPV